MAGPLKRELNFLRLPLADIETWGYQGIYQSIYRSIYHILVINTLITNQYQSWLLNKMVNKMVSDRGVRARIIHPSILSCFLSLQGICLHRMSTKRVE